MLSGELKPTGIGRIELAVYVIAEVEVTDDSWLVEYGEKVHEIVHSYGGEYLAPEHLAPV